MEPNTLKTWRFAAVGVVIIGLGAIGVWFVMSGKNDDGTYAGSVEDVIARMMQTGETSARGDGFTVELDATAPDMPVPDLDRDIPATPDLDTEGRMVVVQRINDAVTALENDPSSYGHWIELGQLRHMVKDYEGAREAWEYAAALGPKTVTPFHNLGDLYTYYLKDYPKAETALKTAIENDPQNPLRYRMLFELYAIWKPQSNEAANTLKEGIEKFPQALDLHVLLARHYRDTGRSQEARTAYDAAIAAAEKAGNLQAAGQLTSEKASLR